jgi:hypothetical protein
MVRHRRNLSIAKGHLLDRIPATRAESAKATGHPKYTTLCQVTPKERVLHAIRVRTMDGPQFAQVYLRVSKFLILPSPVYSRI